MMNPSLQGQEQGQGGGCGSPGGAGGILEGVLAELPALALRAGSCHL